MDDMQKKGMPAEQAVRIMLEGVSRGKREIIIGNFKEKLGVRLNAWLPSVFFKMALKQNPRGEVKLK
jgi:short-subunit dehydrogenase